MALPDKPFQWVANFTQMPNEFFEVAPYLTEPELRIMLYAIRHTIGWHERRESREAHISIRNFAYGYTKDGVQYEGTHLTEVTIRKALPELVRLGLLEKVGGVTEIGQKWKLPQGCNTAALAKREQDRYEKDRLRTVNGRKKAEEKRLAEGGGLSHNPPLSDNGDGGYRITQGGVIAYPQIKNKEKEREESILRPAIADREETDLSHTHTSTEMHLNAKSATAEKVISPAVAPSPSLKPKISTAEDKTPSPHMPPRPPSPAAINAGEAVPGVSVSDLNVATPFEEKEKSGKTESPAQAVQRIKIEAMVACGFAQPITTRGWSNFKGVLKTLTEAKIMPEMYADFVKWVRSEAMSQGGWTVSLNSLAEKQRPERYMDYRAKNAISRDLTPSQVSTTPSGAKTGYSRRNDPAYAHLYADPNVGRQAK